MWTGFNLQIADVTSAVGDFFAIPAVIGLVAVIIALPFVSQGVHTLRNAIGRR